MMNITNQSVSIPPERYLDIIVKGCEYYKVRPQYINRLRNDQPVIPRTQPSSFQSFKDFPEDALYTLDDLKNHDGSDPSLPLWICVNGKILEYTGLPSKDHPDYEVQQHFNQLVKEKLAGREVTNAVAKALYEPLYKLPLTDDDICTEHRTRIEDFYYNTLLSPQHKTYWKQIGRLRPMNTSSL